jgi:hypothetical protein
VTHKSNDRFFEGGCALFATVNYLPIIRILSGCIPPGPGGTEGPPAGGAPFAGGPVLPAGGGGAPGPPGPPKLGGGKGGPPGGAPGFAPLGGKGGAPGGNGGTKHAGLH